METQDIKTLILEQGQVFEQFKTATNAQIDEIKKYGTVLPETKAAVDALNARLDQLDVKLQAKPWLTSTASADSGAAPSHEQKAFEKYVRWGLKGDMNAIERMTAEERKSWEGMRTKALNAQSDTGGGFFVPEDFRSEIIKKEAAITNVESLCNSITTSRDVVRWPKITYSTDNKYSNSSTVTWEDEIDAASLTDPSPIGSVAIQTKKARVPIKVSRELLEDSVIDVPSLLSQLVAENIAVEKDKQFTVGTGGKYPEGFIVNGDISTTNSGASGAFQFVGTDSTKGVVRMFYNVPPQYRGNATWMASSAAMGSLRQLVDGIGNFLWQPSLQADTPPTLMGRPIFWNEHMPTAASASKSLILADFKRLYMVVNKNTMSVQRLDEKYADTDEVGFYFRFRIGGSVTSPWAGQILVLS
jgi:HK97 family phage major capsid protein